ncbi:hypothetical protein CPB84DRAFT_1841008 [Gymnopilus junonius]|uniref:Uncharacterized protein n=1 Tax=Gymnopilus junonius TaxID=109634 RepID=A0A9P5TV53_GYMJU|nr:hypothetical protein CPB84DRAFT_1841008 [Gymnopilus junonius]
MSSNAPTQPMGTNPAQDPQQPAMPTSSRMLQREGAQIFPSASQTAIEQAMLRSSPPPEPLLGKRMRENNDEDENEPEPQAVEPSPSDGPPQTVMLSISNVNAATLRYATFKKLRPDQWDEIDSFLLAKIYVCLLSIENKVDTFRSATPPYQVSEALKTNINNYSLGVLLSVKLSAYKGGIPRNHVLDILKRYRLDLPAGIEHNYADWKKISSFVDYSLTQTCSRLKKLIKESITANTNVFSLAQLIVHSTPCRPTIQLCARVALMRAVHVEYNGAEKLWNYIDECLEYIRTTATHSAADKRPSTSVTRAALEASATAKAFTAILEADRATYGDNVYTIADVVSDDWQQNVDDVVDGTMAATEA